MSKKQVWFFGSGQISVPAFEALVKAHGLLGVVTQPDRRQGRGMQAAPTPIKLAALSHQLPILTPNKINDAALLDQIKASHPELIVVMAYGRILPQALLDIPSRGVLCVHPSLLPRYRGAAPIPWAILKGDHETGITIFEVDQEIDHGSVVLQHRLLLMGNETTPALTEKLGELSASVLLKGIDRYCGSGEMPVPQDESKVVLAPPFSKADGWVNWSESAEKIDRHVRAMNPWPGSATSWTGRSVKLIRVAPEPGEAATPGRPPGAILKSDENGILIQAGQGTLRILELQLAGGKTMPAGAFLRGHPLKAGDCLGSAS